ncbi:hypothetical protein ACFFQW_10105 [Umezawaea endophytica]|uniref:Transcriptional regulator, AbiEi antitoxin, Type IV TA system n=1 Tax=Umezawaea endophytica TaxID=1654476 RepID=A0A9X3AGH3_9PSEU|nr:hypothetical protein [Umezawaea endophytica]MCS7478365.1 hypothetical protein [Umezawaea endophytica]
MPPTNRTLIDLDALATLFRHGVATVVELLHLGLSSTLLHLRCGRGGPWQYLLPGILLLSGSPPTRTQRVQAALRYTGPHTLLTGLDALHLHGIRAVPATGPVHVLIHHRRRIQAPPELRVTRTRGLPNPMLRNNFLTAPPARAALDAARHLTPAAQRAVLAETIRAGTDPTTLHPRASPTVRAALTALPPGPTEAITRSGLPLPRWHIPLHTSDGRPLGTADAWWNTLGLAWQFRTPTRPDHLTAAGVLVVRTTPNQPPASVAAQLHRAATQATTRPRPDVIAG